MSLVIPGTMLFAVFGAGAAGLAWVLFTPQSKRNDRRCGPRERSAGDRGAAAAPLAARAPAVPLCHGRATAPSYEVRELGFWDAGNVPPRANPPCAPQLAAAGSHIQRSAAQAPARLVPSTQVVPCHVCLWSSLVVQMAITATVCMWLMCVWPKRSETLAIA